MLKKILEKNFEKKYFETKIYNEINQCDTIFALRLPLHQPRDKHVTFYRVFHRK